MPKNVFFCSAPPKPDGTFIGGGVLLLENLQYLNLENIDFESEKTLICHWRKTAEKLEVVAILQLWKFPEILHFTALKWPFYNLHFWLKYAPKRFFFRPAPRPLKPEGAFIDLLQPWNGPLTIYNYGFHFNESNLNQN